jgi:hypothetical protein
MREKMKASIMDRRDCDEAEADVILERIAARLDGYTHDEAVQAHPLPNEADDA